MKKQFKILSIAITVLFSCGKKDAENSGSSLNRVTEFSTSISSSKGDLDLLLINYKEGIRFNFDMKDQSKKLQHSHPANKESHKIDRSVVAKTLIRLNGPYGVNWSQLKQQVYSQIYHWMWTCNRSKKDRFPNAGSFAVPSAAATVQ